jgi:D-arabinose 1-dehydrogenase-like Zn-dependent alcohol dehydrogenase
VASRHVSNKMLQFAARHNIKPQIEEYPMVSEYTMKKKEKLIYVDPLSRAESGI